MKIKTKIAELGLKKELVKSKIRYKIEQKKHAIGEKLCRIDTIQRIKRARTNKKMAQFGSYTVFTGFALSGLFYFLIIFYYNNPYYVMLGGIYYILSWALLIIGLYITGKSYLFKKIISYFCY